MFGTIFFLDDSLSHHGFCTCTIFLIQLIFHSPLGAIAYKGRFARCRGKFRILGVEQLFFAFVYSSAAFTEVKLGFRIVGLFFRGHAVLFRIFIGRTRRARNTRHKIIASRRS